MTLFLVEIRVADLAVSQPWYESLLQSTPELIDSANGFTMFNANGVKLSLKQEAGILGGGRYFFEVKDLLAEISRLKTCGTESSGEMQTSSEGYTRCFFRDPDGNEIGLFQWVK